MGASEEIKLGFIVGEWHCHLCVCTGSSPFRVGGVAVHVVGWLGGVQLEDDDQVRNRRADGESDDETPVHGLPWHEASNVGEP